MMPLNARKFGFAANRSSETRRRRIAHAVIPGVLVLVAVFASARAATPGLDPNTAIAFVKSAAVQAIEVLSDKRLDEARRRARFRDVILTNFDAPAIGRFTLGRYWRKASADQRARFQTVFKEAIVRTYTARFFDYSGESLHVTGTVSGETGVTVQSTVTTPTDSEVFEVNWLVVGTAGGPKFIDVVIDGISTTLTQKRDYAAVLRGTGGNLDVLIEKLAARRN